MFDKEVAEGKRFEFGKNWRRFLSVLNEERILQAELSLKEMLEVENLRDKSFVDIGSGSGLFSLAARRLGANVHSLDYDPQSVACAKELKRRYFPDDADWIIEEGSALDDEYLNTIGKFDIVYSWGVLHHTGDMWRALDYVQIPMKDKGVLFIGLYNDEGFTSHVWVKIKRFYCAGSLSRILTVLIFFPYFFMKGIIADLLRLRNPATRYTEYKKYRGMSIFYDWIDWLGGYPYEFVKPGEIFEYYKKHHFHLTKLKTDIGHGINEFVFRRNAP